MNPLFGARDYQQCQHELKKNKKRKLIFVSKDFRYQEAFIVVFSQLKHSKTSLHKNSEDLEKKERRKEVDKKIKFVPL